MSRKSGIGADDDMFSVCSAVGGREDVSPGGRVIDAGTALIRAHAA